jgi:transposase InsO family protein
VNKDVEHLCSESGIELQHTVPYTPQQNGVAERKNKTLKEMANCMLQARALPPKLWDEAINYAAYIQK